MKTIPNHNLITLKRTLRHVLGGETTAIDKCTTRYLSIAALGIRSEGLENAVRRLKVVYTSSVQFVLNHHNSGVPDKVWVCKTGGLPRKFRFLGRYLKSRDRRKNRFALTILRTYVLLKTEVDTDTSPITKLYTGTDAYSRESMRLTSYLLMKQHHIRPYQAGSPDRHYSGYISSSGGPNFSPAYMGWVEDGMAVRAERPLWDRIYELAGLQRNAYVQGVLGKPWSPLHFLRWVKKWWERKQIIVNEPLLSYASGIINFIPEGGGKTRVIAVGDIYSQSVLKPIHDHIMQALRSLGEVDGTFDQSGIVKRLRKVCANTDTTFFSFDLSNCTDRFPVSFQEECLKPLLGERIAFLWREILTNRSFKISGSTEEIRYSVGQPMGFLSSWAAMAWSHHCVIRHCAGVHGKRDFRSYAILGDDLVIWDDKVAWEYKDFMVNVLGVEISQSKSIISSKGLEFAKVLIRKGEVLSPFPLKLMKSVSDFPSLLPMLGKDNYRWFDEVIDPLDLLQLVPKNKWWRAAQLLTSPLYSRGSSVWPVTESQLGAWLKVERVLGNKDPSEVVEEAMAQFELCEYRRHFGHFVTPLEKYLSDLVHPLSLGVPRGFGMTAGDNFIMSTPFTELSGEGLSVDIMFKRFGGSSKRIEKYQEISRLLAKAADHFRAVVPEEVMYYELRAGKLRPNVGQ